mmetsp:Transcript_82701/g.238973  ORF Transcript_82701/g.238973 Transcript_82701/m.238973 type:complete len:262 (-) Transcript_82701:325-1110(-)
MSAQAWPRSLRPQPRRRLPPLPPAARPNMPMPPAPPVRRASWTGRRRCSRHRQAEALLAPPPPLLQPPRPPKRRRCRRLLWSGRCRNSARWVRPATIALPTMWTSAASPSRPEVGRKTRSCGSGRAGRSSPRPRAAFSSTMRPGSCRSGTSRRSFVASSANGRRWSMKRSRLNQASGGMKCCGYPCGRIRATQPTSSKRRWTEICFLCSSTPRSRVRSTSSTPRVAVPCTMRAPEAPHRVPCSCCTGRPRSTAVTTLAPPR